MNLYFSGHEERYGIEQLLMSLFPAEKPVYPPADSTPLAPYASVSYAEHQGKAEVSVEVSWGGKTARHREDFLLDATLPEREARHQKQRHLQTNFYYAAVQTLPSAPPWGMLSGVRPVKLPVRALLQGGTQEDARRLLTETFDVQDDRADLAMDCARATLTVKNTLKPQDLCLYVGIPFCPSRCSYCSFISSAGNTNRLIPAYVTQLLDEIQQTGQAVRQAGLSVRSVYMGGGTPTSLSATQMDTVLTALKTAFPLAAQAEFTVEAGRADTITREKLAVLARHGVNRLAVNPQTLSDSVLQSIGRRHSVAEFQQAFALARDIGFSCINTDLIAGLPEDTQAGFDASVDQLLALAPENITVHTLAKKRGANLQTAEITPETPLISPDYAWSKLRQAGYVPYYLYRQKQIAGGFENVGWCLPDYASEYNICMMEELCHVLALGAGGSSKRILGDRIHRMNHPKYPQEYLRDAPQVLANNQTFVHTLTP